MRTTWLILTFISFLLISCRQQMSEENRKAAEEGLRNSEIKKLSEAEILEEGLNRGKLIADTAQIVLGKTLKSTIQNQGIISALEYCNVAAYPLLDSLSEALDADVKRVSLNLRNPDDAPDEIEKQILEAYQYNIEQGLSTDDNIQILNEDFLLYSKPILIGDPVCLNCHGTPGKEINQETYSVIRKLYPNDDAVNHKIGDLRGMWSIKLNRKEIIKSL